ncbi:hypothetical protein [Maribacter sp.]|uniref:hypothetical protein n=1 Tax=Maribacter sp. TaxID=1897614 RepID=UPI0025BCA5BD|nr:hypothetical protein [Maribacter sp.]
MKKVIVLIILIGASYFLSAQGSSENNDEIKFNVGHFLATSTIGFAYEHYINEDTSIGGDIYFDNKATDYNGNFGLGANIRAYFGYEPRSGFFAEAFGLYYTGEDDIPDNNLGQRNVDYSTLALGLGGGFKLVTFSERFTVELNGGFGRNISPEDYQDTFMYKAGLSVGFRF